MVLNFDTFLESVWEMGLKQFGHFWFKTGAKTVSRAWFGSPGSNVPQKRPFLTRFLAVRACANGSKPVPKACPGHRHGLAGGWGLGAGAGLILDYREITWWRGGVVA